LGSTIFFVFNISGFQLGSTVEAKTKGIWVWCLRHPTKENHCLMLVDTEGFGDATKVTNVV